MNSLELKLPPVALTLLTGLLIWGLSEQFPVTNYTNPWDITIAIVLFFTVSVFALLGVLEFKKSNTTVDPRRPHKSSALVISGIYKLSRNPMYTGFLFMLMAWAFYLSQLLAFLFLPLFVIYMNRFQISPEERFMLQNFGEDYISYMARVRRWI